MQWPNKLSGEIVDFSVDWTARLDVGETIDTSTWSPSGTGLTLSAGTINLAVCSTVATGGTAGQSYSIVHTITTSATRTMQEIITLAIDRDPGASVLVVEDGTGKSTSNAYVSLADCDAYHAARANSAWVGGTGAKEAAIIRATAYLDGTYSTRWPGQRGVTSMQGVSWPYVGTLQALDWPRLGANDADGWPLWGVPPRVVAACCEAALVELASPGALSRKTETGIKSITVGAITKTYQTASNVSSQAYPAIKQALARIVGSGGLKIGGR